MSLDVRCSARLNGQQSARCQLMAGHEDHHAAVTSGANSRMVWLWKRAHREVRELSRALAAGRPWAPTFPAVDQSPSAFVPPVADESSAAVDAAHKAHELTEAIDAVRQAERAPSVTRLVAI
jgi:hypothetical protein